jgi:hypothetical protein
MITDEELRLLRIEQEKWMTQTGTIRRVGYVAEGEPADDNVATDVPVRIKSGFGFFREVADRIQGITAFTLTFPWNTDIRVGDKFIDNNGEVYEIRDIRGNNTIQTALQVLGDRIK